MMRMLPLALAAYWALTGPGHAAGSAAAKEEPAEDETKADPTAPILPASMRRHGVIGHVVAPEGVDILDPHMLSQMRDRLIIYVQDNGK
tara:strand:- start:25329 stop:25595 length:267 start_codon:yes stop_codon:yes gene_type:complete